MIERRMKFGGIWLLMAMIAFAGCGGSKKASKTSYSQNSSNIAIQAFNEHFYNHQTQLYYESTKQEQLASIWTQAIFLEMMMDAYKQTGNVAYKTKIKDIIQGGFEEYDRYNWNNKKVWFIYDDMMWWINALARAYKITKNEKYLNWSETGFKRVWDSAYDEGNGGLFWQFKRRAKNACINYPTVIAAMRLYHITGEEAYFNKAKKVYAWSRKNLFQTATGRVADHKIGNHPAGFEDYTYNQGTCIGAAVLLYKATGNKMYLKDAIRAADYTKKKMCNENGILPAEAAWNEQGVLKTIFVHYMLRLIKDCDQEKYLSWLQKNADVAWAHRDKSRNITFRDYTVSCPKGEVSSYDASSAVGILLFLKTKHE